MNRFFLGDRLGDEVHANLIPDSTLINLRMDFRMLGDEIRNRLWKEIVKRAQRGDPFFDDALSERKDLEFQAKVCSRPIEDDPHLTRLNQMMVVELGEKTDVHEWLEELFDMRSRIRREIRKKQRESEVDL